MLFRVRRVPKRVESTGPRRHVSSVGEGDERTEREGGDSDDKRNEQQLKLFAGHVRSDEFDERDKLKKTKHTERGHVLAGADRLETHERDLHGGEGAESIEARVRHVKARAESSHEDQHEHVQRDHVGDKNVATPGSNHVKVEQGSCNTPQRGAILERLDPKVEGHHEQKDGDGFIIVRSCHRARDVAGSNTDKGGSEQTGCIVLHGGGEHVGCPRGQPRERRRQQDANVSDIDGNVERVKEVVDRA